MTLDNGCILKYHTFSIADETCYHVDTKGQDYTGLKSVNFDGNTCQRWDSMYPNVHSYVRFAGGSNFSETENRCRNPTTWKKPWCYHATKKGWAYCDVPPCVGEFPVSVKRDMSKIY